jgi:uroporphyrinogen-III synthase
VKWDPLPEIKINGSLFSSTDVMKGFFDYEWLNEEIKIEKPVVFIANYKAMQAPHQNLFRQSEDSLANTLKNRTILASGTKTWFELAKQGHWVTASADALGFEFLLSSLSMPLLNIGAKDILILTHEAAAVRWKEKGYNAISNYKLLPKNDEAIQQSIAASDAIFWTSFSQYEFYGKHAKPDAKHLCAGGETADLLKQSGIEPVIFPTIKAFDQWKKYSIHSRSVA